MQIEWSQSALADLRDIMEFIKSRNYQAAIELQDSIESAVEHLAEHPYLYKKSLRRAGWRELVAHPNYIVFYRVTGKVEILAVVHAREQFPKLR
jgi:toxin ParE1/3/4